MLVLQKRFNKQQILDLMADLALQDVPDGVKGSVSVSWDKEGGIEIYFVEKSDSNNSC